MDDKSPWADMPRGAGGNAEASKSPDARKRKRELEQELFDLKMQIAQVEERKKRIGVQEIPQAEERGQPSGEGLSDSEFGARKNRPLTPAFKPRLMLTKTSAANRVWGAAGRASPSLPPPEAPDRTALLEGAEAFEPGVPRPGSAEPQTSPASAAGTPVSRDVSPFSEGPLGAGEDGDGQAAAQRKRYPPTKGVEVGRPSWLPEGWRVEEKVRGQGATAGTKDKYYFSPEGKRFRSRAEIQRFIESDPSPAVPRKKKEGDVSAPNSRPGTPVASPLANRPFDATPEDIQRLLSGAAAGPPSQSAVPKIPSRQKAGGIAPGILPPNLNLNLQMDPRVGTLPQSFPGQWPISGISKRDAPLWQQPLLFPPSGLPQYPGQQPRQSPLATQHPGLDPFGRAGALPLWRGQQPGQAFGIGVPDVLDHRRVAAKPKVKKPKVPQRRLLVADRFHLESLGKRLVKERLASLLQEGTAQRQGERGNQGGQKDLLKQHELCAPLVDTT